MILGACDPGLRRCGLSIWDSGELIWAGPVVSPEATLRGPEAWLAMAEAVRNSCPLDFDYLVLELQQVYPRGLGPPPDDLLQLTGVVGCLTGLYANSKIEGFYPRQWSQVKKEIRHARLQEPGVLKPEEWAYVESYDKETLDAISLGLWSVIRLGERTESAPGALPPAENSAKVSS